MKRLLLVTHAPSDNTRLLRDTAWRSISEYINDSTTLTGVSLAALEAGPADVLGADALLLGLTENLGYMSGGMKDFFDRIYYPCLDQTQGLPVAAWVRAGHDGTGTVRALQSITGGLRWRWQQPPQVLRGDWQPAFVDPVRELALTMAAGLDLGII